MRIDGVNTPSNHLTKPSSRSVMQGELVRIGGRIELSCETELEPHRREPWEPEPDEWNSIDLCEAFGIETEDNSGPSVDLHVFAHTRIS